MAMKEGIHTPHKAKEDSAFLNLDAYKSLIIKVKTVETIMMAIEAKIISFFFGKNAIKAIAAAGRRTPIQTKKLQEKEKSERIDASV